MRLKHLAMIMCITILLCDIASAWCVIGIGNTCGDQSREEGFWSRNFNLNQPTEDNYFDVWGVRDGLRRAWDWTKETVNDWFEPDEIPLDDRDKPVSPYDPTQDLKPNQKIKQGFDEEGNLVYTKYKTITYVKVDQEDPWYYDLDLIQVNGHQCMGCPQEHPNIPGFDYEYIFSIRNTGNVACTEDDGGYKVHLILENLDTHAIWENKLLMVGHPVGTSETAGKIYNFGVKVLPDGQLVIDEQFFYTGILTSRESPMRLTVMLIDDDKETEPGFIVYEKLERTCITYKGVPRCTTKKSMVTKTIHAVYDDPVSDDYKQYFYNVEKLTPDVSSEAGFKL